MLENLNSRRTKIIATLGPATSEQKSLYELLDAGVDLVRLNFSHGEHIIHEKNISLVREWSEKNKREIGIIADLQGGKIRIGRLLKSPIKISKDQNITIDLDLQGTGDQDTISVDYPNLINEVLPKDILILNDGLLKLQVQEIDQHKIICKAINDGELASYKGLNKQGGGLCSDNFTEKDRHDLEFALKNRVDFIALSFVKHHHEVLQIRQEIEQYKSHAKIIAKIENTEALNNLEDIIQHSDGVMVARGDLGVSVGIHKVPSIQKNIISQARANNKPVITATQIMDSMINNTVPTRAEVSDIANAIFDSTDAIMFTSETAIGANPSLVIKSAHEICISSEEEPKTAKSFHRIRQTFKRTDEAIAMAAMYIANHQEIKAIISITNTGCTPLFMSRIKSKIPIYGASPNISELRMMNLYQNVYPILFNFEKHTNNTIEEMVFNQLLERKLINSSDIILVTYGDLTHPMEKTNTLKIYSKSNTITTTN